MKLRSAIVIGGGIAGLTTATLLARAGVSVSVLEQADALREVGAGLQISPNGMVVLRALGLEAALKSRGAVKAETVNLRDYKRIGDVARLDLTQLAADQTYYFVHRADLLDVLQQAARQAGAQIVLNAKVQNITPGDIPSVQLFDGSSQRAELIVGADGVHSVARSVLNPQSSAFFTKQVAWRAIVPNSFGQGAKAIVYMAPGQHIVSYPIRNGNMINLVAIEECDDWSEDGWNHTANSDDLRKRFDQFQGEGAARLAAVTDVSKWGLFRHPIAENWGHNGVALIGDAAHPTLPFLAQGANMALEDAWVLAKSIESDSLNTGLQAYENKRKPRVKRVIETSSTNAWRYHLRHGVVRYSAHLTMRLLSKLAPSLMTKPFDWLYTHDVTK